MLQGDLATHCTINNSLIKMIPFLHNSLLEMVNIAYADLINTFFKDTPYLAVERIEIGAIIGDQSGWNKIWSFTWKQIHGINFCNQSIQGCDRPISVRKFLQKPFCSVMFFLSKILINSSNLYWKPFYFTITCLNGTEVIITSYFL